MSRRRMAIVAVAIATAVAAPRLARSRLMRRRLEVARLAGRVGRRATVNRARRIFADAERREQLDEELSLHTAEEVARTLGQMKGALMKMGQLASFVHDGMPEPVRQALAELQHNAPPMAPALAAQMIVQELGAHPDVVFAEWDPRPIAAASIGQVHRAMTHDGRAVAVKVQYPDVAESIEADLVNMDLAKLVMPLMWKSLDAKAVAEEVRLRLTEELDYRLEAKNQRQFAEWYRDHPFIHVPDVVDELSTGRVLTTELAEGVRFQELETWSQEEKSLAGEAIYRFVFGSYYRFHAFNGDPHPGNYLFRPGGRVTFLDFGLVKHFTDADIDIALRLAQHVVVEPDVHELRRASEDAGYFVPNAPISDERVADYSRMFWEPTLERGVHPITSEWATELVHKYMFGREDFGDILEYIAVPPRYLFLQRINLGVFAILGRLNATSDWRGVAEELWPSVQGAPCTPLGEEEARWLERASRMGVARRG